MKAVRFLFISLLFLLSFFVVKSPVFAQVQTGPAHALNQNASTDSNVPNNLHNYAQSVLIELSSGMTCLIMGIDPVNQNAKCLGINQKTGKIGYMEKGGGAVMAMGYFMTQLYNIPVHTGDFGSYLSSNFGIDKKTLAASPTDSPSGNAQVACNPNQRGIGYCGLTPLLGAWEVMRNIVYLIFVLVFMIIGIAIMLRVHIDPRTVMTIENQIPKLIVGLILVTFSFAISGLIIDIMYTVIFLVFGVMSSIPHVSFTHLDPITLQNNNPFAAVDAMTTASANGASPLSSGGIFRFSWDVAANLGGAFVRAFNIDQGVPTLLNPFNIFVDLIKGLNNNFNPIEFIINLISGAGGLTLGFQAANLSATAAASLPFGIGAILNIAGTPGAFVIGFETAYGALETILRILAPFIIPFLIIMIATIWALFQLWKTLIMAYIFTLVDVVIAPFWLLLGLVPGSKLGFSAWFRDIIANIAVFPVAMTMLWTGKLFMDVFSTTCGTGCDPTKIYVPPLIGASGGTSFLGSILALGIIWSTPEVLKQTRAFVKAPDLNLKSVGQAVGVGIGALNVPGQFEKLGRQTYYAGSGRATFTKIISRGKKVVGR